MRAWIVPDVFGLALVALATCAGCGGTDVEPADMVLHNGRIVTLEAELPEAEALAIRGDRIVWLGAEADVEEFVGPATEQIDLAGRLAIPGFIEGHAHFLGIGDARLQLDLTDVESWEQIVALVAEAVGKARPGELIRGRGWHQEKWSSTPIPNVEGMPTHAALSAISPANPVLLRHASGHAMFANGKAMELAGISRETRDPEGGEIVRGSDGDPCGAFRETAMALLDPARSAATPPDPRRMAQLADDECIAKGVTSFQDAGTDFESADVLRSMAEAGELDVRLWVMVRDSNARIRERMPAARAIGLANQHFTLRGIKHSIDGALGAHGAWLLEPYSDAPGKTGLNTTPIETIRESAELAIQHDLQLCVHAIGDRANRETLDLFQQAFAAAVEPGRDRRWRIEHAQHLHPDDIPRFAELGVVASMQGVHCTSDAPFVLERVGEVRAREGAYVWRDLIESGAIVSNGTDAPVEDVDPIACFHSSVTRRLTDGTAFFPEQRLTRLEALRSYTALAAYAAFEEEIKGTLAPGKLADVVVLSRDVLACPEDEIRDADVDYTIVGGRVAYESSAK